MSSQAPPRWLDDCCRAPAQPTIVVGGATLQSADDQIQGFNTKNGAFTILSDPGARIGDRVTLIDVGGFSLTNPATYEDSRSLPIQDPRGQGIALVGAYAMQVPGGAWTWILTVDAISGTMYWAWGGGFVASEPASVPLSAGGTITLVSSQYENDYLIGSGTLPSNVTLLFPSIQGRTWVLDLTGVTFAGHTVTLQAGGNNWGTVPSASGVWRVTFNGSRLYGSALTP